MPSCKYFRVVILDDKPLIKLTALHLYNNDTRVDQTATLSTGFTSDNTSLQYLKNTTPSSNNVFEINTTNIRANYRYIKWTFTADTNVNCFQIGFGDSELTSLQKFKLQFSINNTDWENILFVGPDKKLAFTMPFSFSELKPNGQCFPFLLSCYNLNVGSINTNTGISFPKITPNKNSIILKNTLLHNYNSDAINTRGWLCGSNGEGNALDGIFNKGKFYFEVSTLLENPDNLSSLGDNTSVYNCLNLAIAPLTNERIASTGLRNTSTTYKTIGLNIPKYSAGSTAYNYTSQNLFNRTLTPKTKFTPGVQHGILLDFDNKQSWFLNTTWTSAAPGKYSFTTDLLAVLSGNSFGLALLFNIYGVAMSYLPSIYLNFGQEPFSNVVPDGYNQGIGPRWREVYDEIDTGVSSFTSLFSTETFDFDLNNEVVIEEPGQIKPTSSFNGEVGGEFYIKGRITKLPDSPNKKFYALLINHENQETVDHCLVSKDGYYEFYGISNFFYTIVSIDFSNNVISETIGPIKPARIV